MERKRFLKILRVVLRWHINYFDDCDFLLFYAHRFLDSLFGRFLIKYTYLKNERRLDLNRWKGKNPRYLQWHIIIFHSKNITETKKKISYGDLYWKCWHLFFFRESLGMSPTPVITLVLSSRKTFLFSTVYSNLTRMTGHFKVSASLHFFILSNKLLNIRVLIHIK